MTKWLNTAHDAEAFYKTLQQYAHVVQDHIAEHGVAPGPQINSLMADADPRHLTIIDRLVAMSENDREHLVAFLEKALRLVS